MARPLTWTDVRGGLIALAILVAAAFGILKFLRVGALHGDSVHVYALVGEAGGLTTGSEVWLSGQKVGKVSRIEFRPVDTDTAKRVLIDMQVLSQYLPAIHRDATAEIRSGGSLIGAIVVYLSPGTTRTIALADGDTIAAKGSGQLEAMRGRASAALVEVPVIMSNVHALAAELQATRGTIGAAMNEPGLHAIAETRLRTLGVINRVHGRGTAALIMEGGLSAHAGHVMARVDSVRALLASPHTSLGRLRRDSTLLTEVADIRRELTAVQASLDEPRGTAGRFLRDSGITNALAGAQREMTLLFADLKAHPFRYIKF
jgi:phospholipid/cholesterol/gamma-HCH transport system substrate-binding protein